MSATYRVGARPAALASQRRRDRARTAVVGPVGAGAYRGRVQTHRSVRVAAVIERPPALPWVRDLPAHEPADSWPGTLLSWRWVDQDAGLWVGLVRYRRDGLMYEHSISGELLTVLPN